MNLLPKQLRREERVLVFDPEVEIEVDPDVDKRISLVALSQLDSSFIPLHICRFTEALEKVLTCIAARYTVIEMPRFHRHFSLSVSRGPDGNKTYAVNTRGEQVNDEFRVIVLFDLYGLGWWRNGPMRMVGAKYRRRLWVGPIPASALTK